MSRGILIENESFNTLKDKEYHFGHNFGLEKQQLSEMFIHLMMLAFLVDQSQKLCVRYLNWLTSCEYHCSSTLRQQFFLFQAEPDIEQKTYNIDKIIFFMIQNQRMGNLVCPGLCNNYAQPDVSNPNLELLEIK